MFRTFILSSLLVLGLIATAMPGFAQTPATPENAAAFVGDWNLSVEGAQGPAQIALTIKVEDGKVVGSVAMAGQAAQPVTDVSLSGKTLVLKYDIDYQGNSIDVAAMLTLAGDKTTAQVDFAGGAYSMTGSAEKKK